VTTNREMPPSKYPKISDGTLVPATKAAMGFPTIPNAPSPDGIINPAFDYDFGSQFVNVDMSGVMSTVPPVIKRVIPTYVPKVDSDGNEIAGVKPLLGARPLGTYLGWNVTSTGWYAGKECAFAGGFIPFARTKAERIAAGDPRPSLEERYGSVWAVYWFAIPYLNDMVTDRYLTAEAAWRTMTALLNQLQAPGGALAKAGEFAAFEANPEALPVR
jgi:hypothetical protein